MIAAWPAFPTVKKPAFFGRARHVKDGINLCDPEERFKCDIDKRLNIDNIVVMCP